MRSPHQAVYSIIGGASAHDRDGLAEHCDPDTNYWIGHFYRELEVAASTINTGGQRDWGYIEKQTPASEKKRKAIQTALVGRLVHSLGRGECKISDPELDAVTVSIPRDPMTAPFHRWEARMRTIMKIPLLCAGQDLSLILTQDRDSASYRVAELLGEDKRAIAYVRLLDRMRKDQGTRLFHKAWSERRACGPRGCKDKTLPKGNLP